ncbi:unnamed protein product [Vicia faba]|uniref:Uncharacterized protein n=1 Tax=Vicia faba TaxID=3906 RepID=A0AAV0YP54_VICFA|nr:unnamed protein product [Vicia faba]
MAKTHATSASERIDELAQQMSIVLSRLDDIGHRLDETALNTVHSPSPSMTDNNHRPRLKLDVSRFNGGDTHDINKKGGVSSTTQLDDAGSGVGSSPRREVQ